MKNLFLIIFTFILACGWGQSEIRDSLITSLSTDLSEEDRLVNLMSIAQSSPSIEEFYSYQKQALKLANELENYMAITDLKIYEARRFFDAQNDEKGMKIMMDQLADAEEKEDSAAMSKLYYSLGAHYFYKLDVDNSAKYMEESVNFFPSDGNPINRASCIMALGVVLQNTPRTEESIKYQLEALRIKEENGAIETLPISLNNIAEMYYGLGKKKEAMQTADRSIHLSDSLGLDWALYYAMFIKGEMYNKEGQFDKAFPLVQAAVDFWEEKKSWKDLTRGYEALYIAYRGAKMPFKAMDAMSNYIAMKDSVHNLDKQNAANEIEAKYESEKKELLLQQEKEEKEFAQKEGELIQRASRTRMIVFVVIGVLLVLNALYFYKRYKDQRKDKELIETQKIQIEERSQEIMDSIIYAKRIQSAILPREQQIKRLLPDSFVLYKPKDVVAGDFYWLEETKDSVLFAAADCTGHGVPGAMVSVVCNNGLNRSVRQHGLLDPADILNKTRELVVEEFNKAEEELKDGMDIALCRLKGSELTFAGAHNPLWIIREGELLETKGDKQPIGRFEKETPFTSHTVQLQKNDLVYIFTDGYSDQFGGDKGKKMKAANFKKFLLSIHELPMLEQKAEINKAFEHWKGELEQLDDVCVIGVRI